VGANRTDADRALHAYAAMRARWQMSSGLYRRHGQIPISRSAAHLWPFSQAFVATLLLAGIDPRLTADFDSEATIAADLAALEHYWRPDQTPPAYGSDIRGSRAGGDRYYDDNAWIGLALVLLERLRPGSGQLDRALQLYQFALSGWDARGGADAGGVFWVEQGRGVGRRNHDRNLVSTGPNAQLGLELAELGRLPGMAAGTISPTQMYAWVLATLDESRGGARPGTGPFWDKVRGDGSIDRSQWSYNQGTMVGLNVLLARTPRGSGTDNLGRAEAIARRSLEARPRDPLAPQPPAFDAIFFRNLLALHAATGDARLREEIHTSVRSYAQATSARLLHADRSRRARMRASLLDESAIVQLLALLAWDPRQYDRLV
jgi:Glycosyl hydrolase family 76